MLPEPTQCLGFRALRWFLARLRLEVVLRDHSREEPFYIGKLFVFLPSDLTLGFEDPMASFLPRMASIYAYDEKLFEQRFVGPPGVAWCE